MTDKGLKIIDNEFLGYNTGWILNFRNSFLDDNYESQNFFWRKYKKIMGNKNGMEQIKKWSSK